MILKLVAVSFFRKRTVRQLQLVLCVALHDIGTLTIGTSGQFSSSTLSEAVESFPNLKVLKVSNGNYEHIHGTAFKLSSASLQQIDWRDAGKCNWITRCQCPNLRELYCLASFYGNGVRPRITNGPDDGPEFNADEGGYFARDTRFDGIMSWLGGEEAFVFEGLEVPDSCLIRLSYHDY